MTFKHFIQLLFSIVQRFFRPMNASPNAKPPLAQTQGENRPSSQVEDVELTLAPELSKAQNLRSPHDFVQMAETGEQSIAQTDEIVQEELFLSSVQAENAEAESLPRLSTELMYTPALQTEEGTTVALQSTPSPLMEKDCIAVGEEKLPLTGVLESILFVADSPVTPAQLAKVLHIEAHRIESGLQALAQLYEANGRGLRLQARDGKFLLITMPAVATVIEDFLNLDTSTKLSTPALETLAVIAYRQPITRMQIEAVRGVDSAGVLRSLVQRGLVEEIGRLEVAGRPFLYGVTDLFMQHFGLTKIEDLPPLQSSEADTLWATAKLAELSELAS